jgi:hypothetical protein
MTNKENAQRIIRYLQDTVEGLKEWSPGCEVETHGTLVTSLGGGDYVFQDKKGNLDRVTIDFRGIKIIGHTPQLNHLLLAINNAEIEQDIEDLYMEVLNRYDLTKSLLANLEDNEELTTYLINLFNLN